MRAYLIPFLLALQAIGAHPLSAQPAPFSMSPGSERPAPPPAPSPPSPGPAIGTPVPFDMQGVAPVPQRPAAPRPNPTNGVQSLPQPSVRPADAPAARAAPFDMAPQGARPPATAVRPQPGVATPVRNVTPLAPSSGPANAARTGGRSEKPILPFDDIRLEGESDARSWAFSLTQDEAVNVVGLAVGYQNAVVVMPEASRLRVIINGEVINDITIASSANIFRTVVPMRSGLLRQGQNIIRIEATQRHRTDCTIRATYELWTQLDSASTSLIFSDGAPRPIRSLEDLPAVGMDTQGITTIRIVAPRIYRPEIRDRLLRLAQMVALRGRYAHPVIRVVESDPGASPAGTIKVVMGIASELRGVMAAPPEAANAQALAIVMHEASSGSATLVVSGPSWNDLDNAINIVGAPALNREGRPRNTVDTASWLWPEVQTLLGGRPIAFSDVGIPTQEFSGRRLRARFAVNLPADFYASDYGEATLFLDAAHTAAVLPGSRIDLYVNGRISATMTITSRGDVFRRHPVRIPMRNFKPGINHLAFETILLTAADERCAPGETLSEANRFVLFDTTSLLIPNFGRIGRVPDLAPISTAGFPFGAQPASIVLARPDALSYSASGTLLARMARDSGEPVRAQFLNAVSGGDSSVVVVGSIDQLPAGMLGRVNISENLKTVWQSMPSSNWAYPPGVASNQPPKPVAGTNANRADYVPPKAQPAVVDSGSTDDIRRRWSENLQRRGFIQQSIDTFKEWVERTFNLSLASLSFDERVSQAYEPPQRTSLLLAQSRAEGNATWTLVTARNAEALADEMVRLTNPMTWSQVSGRVASLDPTESKLEIEPIRDFSFVQTQPFSLLNLRLVAANWMSVNILQYALLLVVCCILLGGATYLMLNHLGRGK
ncbi:cellulose biosynthesis cyclic di-GMP-binding regulatory protein BcsB [Microvirga antarctica]|uniref:cellulose biosynthesis cyclic di-GMP-binding regulatory protein BcsB n=1 Tax=Microvirga antarctica TaxID=2819233 RepID=UPI001B309ADF|nr:cellulose biosynthesis cyclic di-GMP-binding regulatory protein BcsB [Microvirga antarctica]